MIPEFNTDGNLPVGIHHATLEEFADKFAYNSKRAWLFDGLHFLIKNLEKAGCSLIYIDGSFVTKKEIPSDYDLCWSTKGLGNSDITKLDPDLLDFTDKCRSEAVRKYRGDIFPAEIPEGNSGKLFLDFFQQDKNTGKNKGIIAIQLGGSK